jgi:hypothetical protein
MPRVGLETTIPVFERAKTVHALDRASTVIGLKLPVVAKYYYDYNIKDDEMGGSCITHWEK